MSKPYKVFISYPHTLDWNAWKIQGDIEECKAEAFLDSLIPLGDDFEKVILDNLKDCDALWVLLTPPLVNLKTGERISGSIERPYMMLEAGVAWCRNIPIVPILVGYSKSEFADDESIPNVFKNKQAVELHKDDYKRLLVNVRDVTRKNQRQTHRTPLKESSSNRRQANRIPLNLPVVIVSENDGSSYVAAIIEFSEDGSGCFINTNTVKSFSLNDTIEPSFSADIVHGHPKELGKIKIPGIGVKISK
jgi:hypothetical protein